MAITPTDFVSNVHKIVDDRMRSVTPWVGRITGIGSSGYTVMRGGDDVDSLEIPALEPAEFEINDRVLVQPTPNGYDVILGKIQNSPSMRFHYTMGPWSRENITGIADSANETSSGVNEAQTATGELARMATELHALVGNFRY